MTKGHDPGHQGSNHSIHRLAGQLVLHRESHSQVALDANARQEPCAAVDAAVEAEAREGTEQLGQIPAEVIRGLSHLEGQQQQQQEVRQCQAEQEDVDGGRVGLADASNEGPQGQKVGRETGEEDDDVGREDEGVAPGGHDGSCLVFSPERWLLGVSPEGKSEIFWERGIAL